MPENLPEEEIPSNSNTGAESSQPIENIEHSAEIISTDDLIVENIPPSEPTEPVAAVTKPPHKPWIPSFHGEGSQYFVIRLINALIQVVTLNFYYPWAKALWWILLGKCQATSYFRVFDFIWRADFSLSCGDSRNSKIPFFENFMARDFLWLSWRIRRAFCKILYWYFAFSGYV